MKNTILALLLIFSLGLMAKAQELNTNPILSPWAEKVDPSKPLPDYPRPQMVRDNWTNLNGPWDYAIVEKGSSKPNSFQGKITVPYPVESYLSAVMKPVGASNELWYRKSIQISNDQRKGRVLLHFGAVDWEAEVFINGQTIGKHQGGYDPFSFDITDYLSKGQNQELAVRVWDPSDEGPQPRGKQVNRPRGIWYTPVTGIWQTVWMEYVPENYIAGLKVSPDWDNGTFKILPDLNVGQGDFKVAVSAFDKGDLVGQAEAFSGKPIILKIPDPKSWSPEHPHLYDFQVRLMRGNRVVDEVKSYGALRKITISYDENGMQRMALNGETLFQYGPLDQGWWPDGLYTAPTDEALLFDIEKTKDLGFNMIRKHVKVEPARWYYHCDRLGMLVWQDMPSGDMGNVWEPKPGIYRKGLDRERSPESEAIFRKEWKAIIDAFYHFPSIVVWVPFNEAWGQFKTKEITEWTQAYDPSRLVNSASGGNFELEGNKLVGDIFDVHNYPDPVMPSPDLFGKVNILVLGEYGGLGLPIEGHTWQEKDNWGYQSFKNEEELWARYQRLIGDLKFLIPKGLAAAVYTQTTDVEVEVNGLMTYDRKVIKFPAEAMRKLHKGLYE
ncbi:glycoside hydrolase family 2 protein [Cecembia calidifontis]|uniref:Glycosyl hydrolase family 2 n=1 Tax=Cecembia calidifontis TaxID=1187080 RepID=A0A4Q7PCQ5_9BACT|nr:sugar-binding domain-containing protein [Cecembia calidifontis]RZS97380.1 glycosyl hydrolase family 2 [Cecembia calidifontis]